GVQQQSLFSGNVPGGFVGATGFNTPAPTWPNPITPRAVTPGSGNPGGTAFDKNYANPRIYTGHVGIEQHLASASTGYLDFTLSHGVHLTRFVDPNTGSTVVFPLNGDTVSYTGAAPFPTLGSITNTQSSAHSLYRGFTVGARKHFSDGFQM